MSRRRAIEPSAPHARVVWLCDRYRPALKLEVHGCDGLKAAHGREKDSPCYRCPGVEEINRRAGRGPEEIDGSKFTPPAKIPKFHSPLGSERIIPRKVANAQRVHAMAEAAATEAPERMIDQELAERVVALAKKPGKPEEKKPVEVPENRITMKEIAERFGISIEAARERVRVAKIKPADYVRRNGRPMNLYDRAAMEQWIAAYDKKPGPVPRAAPKPEARTAPRANGSIAAALEAVRAQRDEAGKLAERKRAEMDQVEREMRAAQEDFTKLAEVVETLEKIA